MTIVEILAKLYKEVTPKGQKLVDQLIDAFLLELKGLKSNPKERR